MVLGESPWSISIFQSQIDDFLGSHLSAVGRIEDKLRRVWHRHVGIKLVEQRVNVRDAAACIGNVFDQSNEFIAV